MRREGSHWLGELFGEDKHIIASQAKRSSSLLIFTGLKESAENSAKAKEGTNATVNNKKNGVFIIFFFKWKWVRVIFLHRSSEVSEWYLRLDT